MTDELPENESSENLFTQAWMRVTKKCMLLLHFCLPIIHFSGYWSTWYNLNGRLLMRMHSYTLFCYARSYKIQINWIVVLLISNSVKFYKVFKWVCMWIITVYPQKLKVTFGSNMNMGFFLFSFFLHFNAYSRKWIHIQMHAVVSSKLKCCLLGTNWFK